MRIVLLNQTFYPDVAATAQHMWDLARHLTQHGHHVTAITGNTLYGTTQRFAQSHEIVDGIEIRRVQQTAFGKRHLPGRLADFASFYVSATRELLRMPACDAIFALTSPPMISLAAQFARSLRRSPTGRHVAFIHHLMDLYPDAAVATGVTSASSLPTRIASRLTRHTLKHADEIIVLGRDMRDRVASRYNVDTHDPRLHVITPWADEHELSPIPREANPLIDQLGLRSTFNVVYSGNLGLAHDIDTMGDAIELMRSDPAVAWIFIGSGKGMDKLRARAADRNWTHIRFLPYQPREQLAQSLNLADVHLMSQAPAFTGIVVPSKLMGVMAVGKPSIMIGPREAEVSRILTENDAGIVIDIGDPNGLMRSIYRLQRDRALSEQLGRHARAAFEARHSASVCCDRIRQIIEHAVHRQPQ